MCPILSDLKEQARAEREAKHSKKTTRKQRNALAEKPLSKNAYRKQQRKRVGKTKTPPAASVPEKGVRHKCRTKQGAPMVAIAAPTLGSYLPSVQVLCAISLIIGIILLIHSK